MGREYIADKIGNDYRKWEAGDSIIISSQTGSGKSTFVLKKLLPHAIEQGMHVVYFCNRKVLHEQLAVQSGMSLKEFFSDGVMPPQDALPYIHIVTYQYCENTHQYTAFEISSESGKLSKAERRTRFFRGDLPTKKKLDKTQVLYYVFDEAHYFISDAVFNNGTNHWLYQDFSHAISVFLTATPEPLMCFLACKQNRSWISFENVGALINRRAKLRNDLQNYRIIKPKKDGGPPTVVGYKADYINDQCREIQPYQDSIKWLKASVAEGFEKKSAWYFYEQPANYDYINPHYFQEYSNLLDDIKLSSDKWLIFVDKESDGLDLVGRLNGMGISATYLSAETRCAKKTKGYEEFCNIALRQRFDSAVLVATTVLDCGVSISDPKVKNIVIGHSDRTTFLQMLGRRRVSEGESIDLYIRDFPAKTINTLRYKHEQKLQFMIYFNLRDTIHYDQVRYATAADDGMLARTELTANRINQVVELVPSNGALIYSPKPVAGGWYGPYDRIKNSQGTQKILSEYVSSTTALINLLWAYANYQEAAEEHRVKKEYASYLKRQLSWIGKTYDVTRWINYEKLARAMSDYLMIYCELETMMDKVEQEEFRKGCIELLQEYPVPLKTCEAAVNLYLNSHPRRLPQKSRLNKIFEELGLSYCIESKQLSAGQRKTRWHVINKH